ncbi:MAG: cation-translocating P-type ATPase [Methylotenera sp.]|nr:cation-translocating P-type ATPase [Methylotenera sp.]
MLTNTLATEDISPNPSWTILDTQEQWQRFSQPFGDDPSQKLVQSSLLLDDLRCAACSGIVERGLSGLPGIISTRVSMSKKRAVVVWSPELTRPSSILSAIQALGYSASPASHNENQLNSTAKNRAAFWRWLVAGFCMMQVMMYASPSYFTKAGDIESNINHLLNWAAWLLSLPVMLFSSSTFMTNAWRDLKFRRISMDLPVALGIAITFIVSSAATFDPSGWWGDVVYFDSLTMFVFFLLSARLVEVKLHSRTLGAMEALVSRIPENIERQNVDGTFSRVLNSQLSVGDVVRVHIGEAFPADGRLTSGPTKVDESLLTGESTAIHKNLDDKVIAGSYNLGMTVNVSLETIGESTQYGQIVNLINQAAIEKPRLSQLVDRVARPFLLFVILSAVVAGALLWDIDHGRALMTAAAVLIVTCPCALSLATPAAMLASASAFVKRGILIRRLQAIESIANVDTVIFDKTGTLTNNHIEVKSIHDKDGLTEINVPSESTSLSENTSLTESKSLAENKALALAAAIAQHSMHPVSRALVNARQRDLSKSLAIELADIQEHVGAGMSATLINNMIDIGQLKLGSAKFCGLELNESTVKNERYQQVFLADEHGWLATFNLQEAIKVNAAETIKQLKDAYLDVELLSGDQLHTVENTAKVVGIAQFQAACNPNDKLLRLQALKEQGKKVLMVGDGLNDGPILASAHASIAMGKGVPLTLAHADYVLLSGDIGQIPQLIRHAKKTMTIIKQNIAWAIVYNFSCIPLAFFGLITAWQAGLGMAISSLIVVANALRLTQFSNSDLTNDLLPKVN